MDQIKLTVQRELAEAQTLKSDKYKAEVLALHQKTANATENRCTCSGEVLEQKMPCQLMLYDA